MLNNLNLEEFVKEFNKVQGTDFSTKVLENIVKNNKLPEFTGLSIQLMMETDTAKQDVLSKKLLDMLQEQL